MKYSLMAAIVGSYYILWLYFVLFEKKKEVSNIEQINEHIEISKSLPGRVLCLPASPIVEKTLK